jgi:dTDP-glucose 4,6-dehydratase
VRDWLYVVDHCAAILRVLQAGRVGETYNIGGNNEKQNLEVVHTICDLLDVKVGLLPDGQPRRALIRFVTDRPGHDRRYAIDASKIRNELGWEPSLTFEQGIDQTIDWYLAHRDWVDEITSGTYRDYYQQQYGKNH